MQGHAHHTWLERAAAVAVASIAMALIVGVPAASAASGTVSTNGSTLTLRSSASTSGTALADVPNGTTLTLYCKTSGGSVTGSQGTTSYWDRVTYGGRTGYLSAAYVIGGTSSTVPLCGTVATNGSTLTLRSEASTGGSALADIPNGTVLALECRASGQSISGSQGTTAIWDKVRYGSATGYVSAAYVVSGTSTAIPACGTAAVTGTVATSGSPLTLRTGPGTGYASLTSIPNGTRLTLQCKLSGESVSGSQGTTSYWDKVTYGGSTGYVSAAYVIGGTSPTGCTTSPPPPTGSTDNPYAGANGANGGWTPRAAWMRDTIASRFGLSCTTYPSSSPDSEHYTGNAMDCWGDLATRRTMAEWVKTHAATLEVYYVIHEQRIWSLPRSSEGWRWMADRGSVTANHYDHVHISMQHPGYEW